MAGRLNDLGCRPQIMYWKKKKKNEIYLQPETTFRTSPLDTFGGLAEYA